MIVTLTLNPSVDRTVELPEMRRGQVNRATHVHLHPGGKGVNVARALVRNGVPATAVVVCGGLAGEHLRRLLAAEGVPASYLDTESETRSNVTIVEAGGATVTKLNEPGGPLSAAELDAVYDLVAGMAAGGDWVVLCGSLPPGTPVDTYRRLTRRLVAGGARVAVDTSGPALRSAVEAGPALVKPNQHELEEAVGRPLASLGDVVDAAHELRSAGADSVLASLGGHGAVLVDGTGVICGRAAVERPRSTVGAGDALLAGYLAGLQTAPADPASNGLAGAAALAEGLAWSAAAVGLAGSGVAGPGDLRRDLVRIEHTPDLDRLLAVPA
jgi:1-phosphofructokinase